MLWKHAPSTMIGLTVVLEKNDGLRRGAEVASVDLHGVAWLAGLEAGDLITMIATEGSDELLPVRDGYHIRDLLQSSQGNIHLRVRRRKWSDADLSARVLQAAWRGAIVRMDMRQANAWSPLAPPRLSSGSTIAPSLQRASSSTEAVDAALAALTIQCAWRRIRAEANRFNSGSRGCMPLASARLSSSSWLLERSGRTSVGSVGEDHHSQRQQLAAQKLQAAWRGATARLWSHQSQRWSDCMSSPDRSPTANSPVNT